VTAPKPYPLHWPSDWKRAKRRDSSRFRGDIKRARNELFRQLNLMHATQVVVSSNLRLNRDGTIDAGSPNPTDPGVAVYFLRRHMPMVFACDSWSRAWENVLAVAKTIEAIRGIERWGAASLAERAYSAFHALPPPAGEQSRAKPWREVLGVPEGLERGDALILAEAKYRRAIARVHPDKGGDAELAAELNGALESARTELR